MNGSSSRLSGDEKFFEDLADIMVAQSRRSEPTRPLDEVLHEMEWAIASRSQPLPSGS